MMDGVTKGEGADEEPEEAREKGKSSDGKERGRS
jgi:hypothetical protein